MDQQFPKKKIIKHSVCIDQEILLVDGRRVRSQYLQSGDQVLNGAMEVTTISSVQKIPLSSNLLYGINGQKAVFSEDQAILTQRGWCSLNPSATKALHPAVRVARLRIGDIVWGIDQQKNKLLIEVKEIHTEQLKATAKQVLFYPREGYPSAWMDGYCVLLNDPAITMSRTAHHVARMGVREQRALKTKMDEMRPILEKSFGKNVVHAAMDVIKDPRKASNLRGVSGGKKSNFGGADLKDLIIPSLMAIPHDPSKPLPKSFANLSLVLGHLIIDGEKVDSHTDGDHLFWTRMLSGGVQENGTIQFNPARHYGAGVLAINEDKIQFSVYSEIDYKTTINDSGDSWYEFAMEFTLEDDQRVAIGVLKDKGQPLSTNEVTVALSTMTDSHNVQYLTADIEWNPTWVAWEKSKWIAANITWATDYRTFSGQLYEYDPTKPQNRGNVHTLYGTAENWDQVEQYLTQIKALQMNPEHPSDYLALTNIGVSPSSGIEKAIALVGDTPLTVEALYSLAPPDMSQVHENCFSTIKNMMLYVIPDQQLSWFNETRPGVGPGQPLTQAQATLAQNDPDINSFLINDFALGYLTQAFSQSTDPKIKDLIGDDATKNKLGFFWQGDGDQCFPKLKGYNLAAAHVMDSTYASMVPGLDRYLADTTSNWGQQLYEYCLNPATINGLAMQNMMAGGSDMINSLTMKLHCLSPNSTVKVGDKTVSYATSLYESIVNVRLQNISQNYTAGDQEDLVEYLTAFLQEYFTTLLNGGGNWSDEIRAAAAKDLSEYMQENGIQNMQALMNNMGSIVTALTSILISAKSSPLTLRLAEFAQQYPRIAKLGGVLTFATYALCFVNLYQAITNWKNLTPVQKAQVVTSTAYAVVSMFKDFASYKAAKALTTGGTPGTNQMNAAMRLNEEVANNDFVPAGDEIVENVVTTGVDTEAPLLVGAGRAAGEVINAAEGTSEIVSRWTSIANVSGKIAEGLGVLAMAAACVVTGFQIADDFKTNQPWDIKMLDILQEISNGVCFLVSAGVTIAGLIGVEVASFIPVIGVVVAVIGIVIAIVELFVHRDPPPTPEESFVSDHCVPFVQALQAPSQSWLDDRAKAQQHLNGN